MTDDYYVYLMDLPLSVKACSTANDDGTYSIFVNQSYPGEIQKEAAKHELKHIQKGHFTNEIKSVAQKEYEINI